MNDDSKTSQEDGDESAEGYEKLTDDVDSVLDEIDEVLEENAEEFVRSYVRNGGQGWSDFFTPEFYVGAATAGVLGGLAYDEFRASVLRVVKYVRDARGGSGFDPFAQNMDSHYYEDSIRNAWRSANRLVRKQGIEHSIDEATALHWTLFMRELDRDTGTVRLGRQRHSRLAQMAIREDLSPSGLAARIIDQWLKTQR